MGIFACSLNRWSSPILSCFLVLSESISEKDLSKMNIDEILKYTKPKENFYDILGCSQSSSIDQINREYKIKALMLHPDKNPDPESVEKFAKIQNAKEVLTDAARRKLYDTWLNSGIMIPFEQFQAKKGHSMHWAPPRRNVPLGLGDKSTSGQGSESTNDDAIERTTDASSFLDRFRRYEI